MMQGFDINFIDRHVVDPFAGGCDLMNYAIEFGAASSTGYDLHPTSSAIIQNDSLMDPIDYTDKLLFSNPPYLAANKCRTGDKRPYDKWKQSDYYKCHLASLYPTCDEAVLVLPANFLSESSATARNMLFKNYICMKAKYWTNPMFNDTSSTICMIHIIKGVQDVQQFPCTLNDTTIIDMVISAKNGWLFGDEFFDYINVPMTVYKCDNSTEAPNTHIVIGILDKGSYGTGYHLNYGDPKVSKKTAFTTFQVRSKIPLSENEEREIVKLANEKLNSYRTKYSSMFMSNYLGPNQKILSVTWARKLLSRVISDVKGIRVSIED